MKDTASLNNPQSEIRIQMPDEPNPPSKIIVDDDWKSRVQAEKEAAVNPPPAGAPPSELDTPRSSDPVPPASFTMLVTTLATQVLAALGQFPMGDNEQPVVMLDHAKHFIDTLDILEKKTKGNLTDEEAKMLENLLHELRMVYVAVSRKQPPA